MPDIGAIVQLALMLDITPDDAKILIRKSRHAFGDEKHDYKLLKKLYREQTDEVTFDDEYKCYADILDRDFPTALRRILTWRGLTQKQFAILCGVGKNRISEWMSGKRQPDLEQIYTILKLPQPIVCRLKNF